MKISDWIRRDFCTILAIRVFYPLRNSPNPKAQMLSEQVVDTIREIEYGEHTEFRSNVLYRIKTEFTEYAKSEGSFRPMIEKITRLGEPEDLKYCFEILEYYEDEMRKIFGGSSPIVKGISPFIEILRISTFKI